MIVEDNEQRHPGGAASANANVMIVKEVHDVNLENIMAHIRQFEEAAGMNILLLMAGSSDAFKEAGYLYPKNLVESGRLADCPARNRIAFRFALQWTAN